MIRLIPRPPFLHPSTVSNLSLILNFPINLLTGEGGRGRGAKSYDREKAWPSRNQSILSAVASSLSVAHTCVKWLTTPHEILKCHKNTYYSTHVTPLLCIRLHLSKMYTCFDCPASLKGWFAYESDVQYILSLATSYFYMLLGPELTLIKNDFRIKKHFTRLFCFRNDNHAIQIQESLKMDRKNAVSRR